MAHVQSAITTGALFDVGTTTYTYTYPVTPTSGNLVVIALGSNVDRTVTTVAGTGMSFTINGADTTASGPPYHLSQWYAIANGTDTDVTITLSGSGSGNSHYFAFLEFDSAAADQSTSNATGTAYNPNAGTAHDSGILTPNNAANIVVASIVRTNGSYTEDGGFTLVTGTTQNWAVGYIVQSSATAQEMNVTALDGAGEYSCMRIGAFVGTGGGGGGGGTPTHGLGRELSSLGWGLSFGRNFVR